MITKEMWAESLSNEEELKKRGQESRDNLLQTKFVGQAMSEIKSDPRWKSYADHIQALRNNSIDQRNTEGEFVLTMTDEAGVAHHKQEYLKCRIQAETYTHVLKLIEALIERGETATEKLKEIEYGET